MLGEALARRACADTFTGLVGAPKCMKLHGRCFGGGAVLAQLALLRHVPSKVGVCEGTWVTCLGAGAFQGSSLPLTRPVRYLRSQPHQPSA